MFLSQVFPGREVRPHKLRTEKTGSRLIAVVTVPGGATVVFKGALGDSVTVVPQSSNSPGIMTSSFGAGVTLNGKIRKGIIVSHFINKYYEYGFSDTITFSHYSENGHSIGGTVILTRISDSSFTRISQLTFSSGGGAVSTYNSATTRTYSFGVNAPGFVIPAVYTFNETGVITSHNGSSGSQDTSTIITPLRYLVSAACTLTAGVFPISGTVNLTSSAQRNGSLVDYGAGTCDLTFTITVGAVVKTITLAGTDN